MEVPGLGEVTKDERFGWYYSKPMPIPMFGGKECRIVLEGFDEDEHKEDFHVARQLSFGKPGRSSGSR